ncbi:PQQ-binding-like beta-propeller repeat protein [Streptomyces sp. NRRL S-1521]|uniref:outer membrane protein assembly factor BamB family protein n=1 Tax=Streptomyces sp. NRRL S-1521 TaxID=1609100 RepID=UPI000748CB82|nr:PQQ-binding-like beta-propeller repeat protein [Streptomyces sp. NRRL S-1521]KUL58461.1 hypothetical protein ADL30_09705 [Streptomyces sp. NRRL S-1521]
MTAERVEEKVRETLRSVALDGVRAPEDLVEQVVRRRGRRRFSQAAGAAVAVAAVTAAAVFGFGGTGDGPERSARPAASPEGWRPWQADVPEAGGRGCLVDGSALYCSGSKYDAAKFDAGTGKRLWTVKVNREGDGIDRPFAVRDGVVYAYRNHTAKNQPDGDYMGGTDLMAVDADNGDVLWWVKMPQDDRTGQAAMLINGAVLANTPSLRTLSALDPRTGKEKWRHTWDRGTACQRAVLGGVPHLLCTRDTDEPHDTDVIRLDPVTGDATKVTTVPGRQQLLGASEDQLFLVRDRAVTDKNMLLTTVSSSGEQTSRTRRADTGLATSEVVGDRLITVNRQGRASVYSLTTGETLWSRPVGIELPGKGRARGIAAPVVSTGQGVVYFFGPTGDLSGLDLRTGEQVWRGHVDTGEPGPGPRPGETSQVLLYGDVLITQKDGRLVSLLPRIDD